MVKGEHSFNHKPAHKPQTSCNLCALKAYIWINIKYGATFGGPPRFQAFTIKAYRWADWTVEETWHGRHGV